ncbi:MAG: hypothetical protein NE330_18735 [Lentisphaeraceae bacterium]|nr:hypothetical protein [Lentisphaeraceae bacterium]
MKKLNYTLIELLAAMGIFIMMIGILFKTFTASADVATSETTRLSIMIDANVFYHYLTSDIKAMSIEIIPAPENDQGEKRRLDTDDIQTAEDLKDKELNVTVTGSVTTIEFFSDITPYNLAPLAGAPYVEYRFDSSTGYITRKHFTDSGKSAPVYADEPIILEGVEDFTITVWDDYPGGNQMVEFPTPTKPSCITFSVTMTSPNPYASDVIKERSKRTISKTLYLNR